MKFIAQSNSGLIESGTHLAIIAKVYSDKASTGADQLAVQFEASGKQITRWYNLQGFKVDPEQPTIVDDQGRTLPNYLTDKKGNRVVDTAKTESCLSIIGQLATDAGIAKGAEFEAHDLEGLEVGIEVEEEDNGYGPRLNVKYSMPASRVSDAVESF